MVSVLVLGSHTATGRPSTTADAVRTLAALVPAAVDGVVRDVQLLAAPGDDALDRIADHAGCGFIQEADLATALQTAVARARGAHHLVLLAGVSFDRAFVDEMAGIGTRHAAWVPQGIALKAVESGVFGRVLPRFAPTVGVLTERQQMAAVRANSVAALWRSLRPHRVFRTRAWSGGDG
ncbi:hypothetical protein P7D22_07685 [Lichenihabitans sp. Uapishka_5]|uniref:hypothetical protein n=1 Tax=Lichenihabitans sp. Uapishka_5 TaxID=3037302 RepID=UPI0029E81314|nr:hypothetical protein [Lichenihabitans sp. Uapishka_5]MDX7951059.1 hypothetical protein [Lichenihabitans sp. Uapishka_5]